MALFLLKEHIFNYNFDMTSKQIVREIVQKIFSGELSPNDKLPSENQIAIKYSSSRMMATKAYINLKQVGAIYSKPKKGFFVSEHFSGILRSIDDKFQVDNRIDNLVKIDILKNDLKNFVNEKFISFERDHIKFGKLIIKSKNWLNENYIKYEKNNDIVANLIWSNRLTNSVTFLKFEEFKAFNKKKNLVLTTIYYAIDGIAFVQKAVVKESIFTIMKNEWSI